jgi:hypothetical protein
MSEAKNDRLDSTEADISEINTADIAINRKCSDTKDDLPSHFAELDTKHFRLL